MTGTVDVSSDKERTTTLINEWCSEKGTKCFADQLVKLLDKEFMRLWPGLSHIIFPKKRDRLRDGSIPDRHWHFRFYSGCVAVLGWTERVVYGDFRYFGADLHAVIKRLWPDEDGSRSVKVIQNSVETVHSAKKDPACCTTIAQFTLLGQDNLPVTCSLETTTSIQVVSDDSIGTVGPRRLRFPEWIYKKKVPESDTSSEEGVPSEDGSHTAEHSDEVYSL